MTDREKAIVMAYTGKCMLTEDKFHIFHEYIEEIMGRPVFTHELADKDVSAEIKEKAEDDFITLCEEEEKGQYEYMEEVLKKLENLERKLENLEEKFNLHVEEYRELAEEVYDTERELGRLHNRTWR